MKKIFLAMTLSLFLLSACNATTVLPQPGDVLTTATDTTVWFAPGGPGAPAGFSTTKVGEIPNGESVVVSPNKTDNNWYVANIVGNGGNVTWIRVKTSVGIGWMKLSDLQ